MGHNTNRSTASRFDKHSNQPRANLICIRNSILDLSDPPVRLGQAMLANHIIRLCPRQIDFAVYFLNLSVFYQLEKNLA